MPFCRIACCVTTLALIAIVPGCSDAPTHPAGCSGTVSINVSQSIDLSGAPQFDWSPRCGITDLTVIILPNGIGDPAVMWELSAPQNARIGPPVIYGRVPSGATAGITAQPLQSGATYRVSIVSITGGNVIDAEGEKTFVR